ncbi:maleylpyruvate isomerase family mycothiol-dependent enzyme [Streptomyces mordarskii]|uniref:Mycothiol-dependent maleylpyruvate isomerase metal-binding domain-containing protein n=1 Tax=Streptomyces mordarskii TaxID=1226758 RepID=A0ABN1CPF1_9ACTN
MDRGVPRELLDDLTAEFDSLRTLVPSGTNLRLPTPAVGWDVGAGVSHLIGCDLLAEEAVGAPGEFRRARPATDVGPAEPLEGHITARKDLPVERLRQEWADAFAAMLRAFTSSRREQRVPWFGPPMSPATLATARLMEYFVHGQNVADVLKIVRRPTDRLRHVCHLGFVTFEFSFANRGLPVPPSPPRVELRLPSGRSWARGPEDADAADSAQCATAGGWKAGCRGTGCREHRRGQGAVAALEHAHCAGDPRCIPSRGYPGLAARRRVRAPPRDPPSAPSGTEWPPPCTVRI